MLTLTRGVGGRIRIGDDIEITVVSIKGGKVRIGIEAPKSVFILRDNAKELEAKANERDKEDDVDSTG